MRFSISKYITKQDGFGHVVQLNFNRNGAAHKTLIGGIFSILVNMAVYYYVFTRFKILFFREGDKRVSRAQEIDLAEIGEVDYFDSSTLMFWVLRDSNKSLSTLKLDAKIGENDLDQYIEFSYLHRRSNYFLELKDWH